MTEKFEWGDKVILVEDIKIPHTNDLKYDVIPKGTSGIITGESFPTYTVVIKGRRNPLTRGWYCFNKES
jgi:hypothetical protein